VAEKQDKGFTRWLNKKSQLPAEA